MRVDGWPALLRAYLDQSVSFEWGIADCARWSAGWVHQATGKDFISGEYATEAEAAAYLADMGFTSVADLAGTCLTEIGLGFVQRGDIVLHPVSDSLGICDGLHSRFLTQTGMTRIETRLCRKAWRVE